MKLCDLGHTRDIHHHTRKLSEDVSTRSYKAPELLLNSKSYGKEIDIWGLGCTLAEMYSKSVLFKGKSTYGQLESILEITGQDPREMNIFSNLTSIPSFLQSKKTYKHPTFRSIIPSLDPLAEDLLIKMLKVNPKERLTID